MDLNNLYQELILDNYKHPYHKGLRDEYQKEVHHVNTTCGDEITLRILVDKASDKLLDISYDSEGCAISQASISIMARQLEEVSIDKAMQVFDDFSEMISSKGEYLGEEDLLGDGIALSSVAQYPARVKCALLGWMAFKDALSQALAE